MSLSWINWDKCDSGHLPGQQVPMVEIGCSDDILITPVVGPGEEVHIDSHEIFENESPYKC